MFDYLLTTPVKGDKMLSRGEQKFEIPEVLHMSEEDYKKLIIEIISASHDIEYLVAVYTFAKHYPDKEKE